MKNLKKFLIIFLILICFCGGWYAVKYIQNDIIRIEKEKMEYLADISKYGIRAYNLNLPPTANPYQGNAKRTNESVWWLEGYMAAKESALRGK